MICTGNQISREHTRKNNTKYYELALSECVWVCVRTRVIYCNCFICIVIIFVSFEQTLDTKRYTWQLFIVTLQSTIPQFRLCGWVRACAHRGKMMIQNVRTNKKQMPLQRWFFLQYSLLHHFLINRKKRETNDMNPPKCAFCDYRKTSWGGRQPLTIDSLVETTIWKPNREFACFVAVRFDKEISRRKKSKSIADQNEFNSIQFICTAIRNQINQTERTSVWFFFHRIPLFIP